MKLLTTLLFTCCYSLIALGGEGINFVKNLKWAQIKARAAKEKKMIFFDAYTTWCGPCKYLEQSVYTDAAVAAYYNANFINVKFDMETAEGLRLAEEFDITSYPTLLYFNPAGKPVHKFIGAMEAADFISLGKEARDPNNQYFTLRQKVLDRQASTADFMKWTEKASELEDNNRGAIASTWLSNQPDILANAELAKASLLFSEADAAQLSYLYKEKDKIRELLNWDAKETRDALYRQLFTLALKSFDQEQRNFKAFEAVIRKFEPAKLNYAVNQLQLMLALNSDSGSDKAIDILIASLWGTGRIGLDEMCGLLVENSPHFNESDMKKLKTALETYKLTVSDKGYEWGLYLAEVICYSKLNDSINAKISAEKAYRHTRLPDTYKPILKETYGLRN